MLGDCLPVINFSLKGSVELSTAKSLIEAQNLKVTAKSGRSRVVDSPPLTLQTVVVVWSSNIAYNVLGLCVRAGFGAQNCLPALHLIRSTKLQVCTSPRLTQNPCYSQCFFVIRLFMVFLSNLSICPL